MARKPSPVHAWAAEAVQRIDALPLIGGECYGVRPCYSLPELRQLRAELRAELKRRFGTTSYWPLCCPVFVALAECTNERHGVAVRHVRVHARVARLRTVLAGIAKSERPPFMELHDD